VIAAIAADGAASRITITSSSPALIEHNLNNALFKDSIERAVLAVLIVFSVAVIIAVSDPRPSGSSADDGSGRANLTGRRFPPPVPATPVPAAEAEAPVVAIEAPPTSVPEPTQNLLQIVATSAERSGLAPAVVPAGDCNSWVPADSGALPVTFTCGQGAVVASAAGRVLIASESSSGATAEPSLIAETWSWDRGLSLGNFVVIDHGPTANATSTITVYSRLTDIDPALRRGVLVEAGQRIGGLGVDGDAGPFTFGWEMWVNDQLAGIAAPPAPPEADIAVFEATQLAPGVSLPTPDVCPFPDGDRISFPNSARTYRSGVHQGIDFGCGLPGIKTASVADGTIAMIVNNIEEPTFGEREAILASAAAAGSTPSWILTHLYGNFIVIDHGTLDGTEDGPSVFSIYAHLENVDPTLTLGSAVAAGQSLGVVGDSGTSAASRNVDEPAAIHLHWELHIDEHYLGEDLSAAATMQVYRSLFCRNSEAISCT